MEILYGFGYFLMLVLIIFLAYLTSRWLAVKTKQLTIGKYMAIADRIILGKDKGIIILKVGERYYLMSENATGFTNITQLEASELVEMDFKNGSSPKNFSEFLNKYLGVQLPVKEENAIKSANTLNDLKVRVADAYVSLVKKRKENIKSNDQQNKTTKN